MTPSERAEVMEAAGRLAVLVGRDLPEADLAAAGSVALDPEDVPLVAGLIAMVRHHLDHVPGSVEAFGRLLPLSMSDNSPCRT